MANKSAKKTASENARILRNVQLGMLIVNLLYVSLRFAWWHDSFSRYHVLGYLFTWLPTIFIYRQLEAMSRPIRDASGAIVDTAGDLTNPGLVSYMFDILYVTWFVHLGSLVWQSIWWLYLSIPAYAMYKLFGFVRPMLGGMRGGQPAEPVKSKRQQKMEQRQGKVRYAHA